MLTSCRGLSIVVFQNIKNIKQPHAFLCKQKEDKYFCTILSDVLITG